MTSNQTTLYITVVDMFGRGEISEKQAKAVIKQLDGIQGFEEMEKSFKSLMRKMKKELKEKGSL